METTNVNSSFWDRSPGDSVESLSWFNLLKFSKDVKKNDLSIADLTLEDGDRLWGMEID